MTTPTPVRPADQAALELLHRLSASGPVQFSTWRNAALADAPSRDSAKRAFNRSLSALQAANLVQIDGDIALPLGAEPAPDPHHDAVEAAIARLLPPYQSVARRLLIDHDRLAKRLRTLGQPGECWNPSARHDVASALFINRLELAFMQIPIPPLDAAAKAAFDATAIPQHLPEQGSINAQFAL
jgi:hypothetical protein